MYIVGPGEGRTYLLLLQKFASFSMSFHHPKEMRRDTGLESTTGNLTRPNLLGHLFFTLLTLGEKVDFRYDDAAFGGKSCFCFDLLFECNCS